MSEIELLPCPFCGGEAVVHVNDGVRVICRNCSATTKILVDGFSQGKPNGSAIKSVINAWNTRKPMERIAEQLEEELNLADKEKERCARENKLQFDSAKSYAHGISIAIEIVKAGGTDERIH